MTIVFVDQFGAEGRVNGDLPLDYGGPWPDEIESFLDALQAAEGATDSGPELAAVDQGLLLELPERVPVKEIERREE